MWLAESEAVFNSPCKRPTDLLVFDFRREFFKSLNERVFI